MQYIYWWEVVLVAIFIGVLVYFKRQRDAKAPARAGGPGARRTPKAEKTEEEAYMDLRRQAIETNPKRLVLTSGLKPEEAFGVLMEMGISTSVVTLAAFADGDASIYYKTGGGMIGGGSHETVRAASKDLVARAQKALPRMTKTTSFPLPEDGRVRFYVLTQRGVFTTETSRQSLGERPTELAALFASGQEVVAQMRQVEEQRSKPAFAPPPMPPPDEPEEAPA